MDVSGRAKTETELKKGTELLRIDTQNFSDGIYFIRLAGELNLKMEKIIVSKN